MKRTGIVYYKNKMAGLIEQDEGEYRFTYDPVYLSFANAEPISLTLPLQSEPHRDTKMIPFFDGLIPEGWLLSITERKWKVNQKDRMGLLLSVCEDCIGAVSVIDSDKEKKS